MIPQRFFPECHAGDDDLRKDFGRQSHVVRWQDSQSCPRTLLHARRALCVILVIVVAFLALCVPVCVVWFALVRGFLNFPRFSVVPECFAL